MRERKEKKTKKIQRESRPRSLVQHTQKETQLLNVDHIAPKWMEWICGEMRFSARQLNYSTHNVQIYTCKDSWTKTLAYLVSNRALLGKGGGGLLRHDGLPIASQNVHYASLKLFEKIQTAKKEFNVHKVLYIHCTQRIVHFCVCVCVSVTNLYVYRKKKKKEKNMQYTLSYRSLLHD